MQGIFLSAGVTITHTEISSITAQLMTLTESCVIFDIRVFHRFGFNFLYKKGSVMEFLHPIYYRKQVSVHAHVCLRVPVCACLCRQPCLCVCVCVCVCVCACLYVCLLTLTENLSGASEGVLWRGRAPPSWSNIFHCHAIFDQNNRSWSQIQGLAPPVWDIQDPPLNCELWTSFHLHFARLLSLLAHHVIK